MINVQVIKPPVSLENKYPLWIGCIPVEQGGHVEIPVHQLNVDTENLRHSQQFSLSHENAIRTNILNVAFIIFI
jgi:hypothetical protein